MGHRYAERECARASAFERIWSDYLDRVFEDVARYYDRANVFATLGLLSPLRRRFVSTIDIKSHDRVLDVCAGTNVVGIELLKREPTLEVHAIDKSQAMQDVGTHAAGALGLHIESHIGDVHRLPFPDNHFDIVTLQWASRHLRVIEVLGEVNRVLKPGGRFYHCDMLRPANRVVEQAYYLYLTACVGLISWAFRSGPAALECRRYFVDAIRLFYSTAEFSRLLEELGFSQVVGRSVLLGAVAFHRACKP
ncbi:MAG TPA: class I SAM-dependent methyltransferase [Burkholderiales bacterium]|nr:class I SAM-dependent methyltransferase [Burkholderiales bacterium]